MCNLQDATNMLEQLVFIGLRHICYDKRLPARLGEHMSLYIAQSHLLRLVYSFQETKLTSQQPALH